MLAVVVGGHQPDEISRNVLTPRLCGHFALGPFSMGFPMSFPRSLRPAGAKGQSAPPLPGGVHLMPSSSQAVPGEAKMDAYPG